MNNVVKRIVCIVIILLAVGCISLSRSDRALDSGKTIYEVEVKNGIANPLKEEIGGFNLEEEGEYVVNVTCKNDKPGLITGIWLLDEKDKVLFFATGEYFELDSNTLALEPGVYRMEVGFITNEKQWDEWAKGSDAEHISYTDYEFAENGNWNIELEYGIGDAHAMSIEYLLGILVGVGIGLIIVAVAAYVIRKLGGKVDFNCNKESYDERQMLARGLACKYAYTTLSISVVVAGLLSEMAGIHWFMSFGGICVILGLSVAVFITICIVKDAYMSMYENVKGIVMLFVLCIGINLIPAIMCIVEKRPFITEGRLTMNCLNLGIVILFIYILIVFLARIAYNKRELEEDEE